MQVFKHLDWERVSDNSFRVYYEDSSIEIKAENVVGIFEQEGKYHGILAENGQKYTLYLKAMVGINASGYERYFGLYKFDKDILEYYELFKGMLIYKKEDGWYFSRFRCDSWHLDEEEVRNEKIKRIEKFCGPDVKIVKYGALEPSIYFNTYVVSTNDGSLYVYEDGISSYELFTPIKWKKYKLQKDE